MRLLPAAAIAMVCAACAAGDREPQVVVVDDIADLEVEVLPDALVFRGVGREELGGLTPGDLLASAEGAGFLREVVSTSDAGDALRVATAPATLDDAELAHHAEANLGKADSFGLDGLHVALPPADLGAADPDGVEVHLAGGHLDVDPDLNVDLRVRRGELERFRFEAEGAIDAALSVDVTAAGEVDKYLFKKLSSQRQVFVQMIGAIPVVEVVELSVGLGVGVRTTGRAVVHLEGSAAGALSAGAIYANGAWTPTGERSFTFAPDVRILEADGEVEVSALLFASVEVRFYDLAGPVLRLAPYVSAHRATGEPTWTPRAGVKGFFDATVKLPIINRGWHPYRVVLFDAGRDFPAETPAP